jgi:transposase, IS30 family
MSKNYNQLSLEQRYQIEALVKAGIKQNAIAGQLGVHPSTISRELKRNVAKRGKTAGEYLARIADRRTKKRHEEKPKRVVFSDSMKQTICHYLQQERWSPELISKCLDSVTVSHEWIYQWIWKSKHINTIQSRPYKELYRFLKHGRRKRKRGNIKDSRGTIPNRTPIDQRPGIVSQRKRVGDIEVDLMIGKDHKGAILVMTDRATLQTRLKKLLSKESEEVSKNIISALKTNSFKAKTLTFDNDKAFSGHMDIAKEMTLKTYFTRPYTSQDKGTVENRIGVIRRFLPKKTNLTFVTEEMIAEIENKINNRPVRKFKYLTPNQVLRKKIALMT